MKSKINELLELVKENPDLPVIPMVYSEVVGDNDGRYWIGNWGMCEVTEYCYYDGRFYTRDDDDYIEDLLIDEICAWEEYRYATDETIIKKAHDAVNDLEWTKAIIVYIGL